MHWTEPMNRLLTIVATLMLAVHCLAQTEDKYLSGRAVLNCADETAAQIDQEVMDILKESYDQALAMLKENREVLDKIADFLINRETITGKEFMEILRRTRNGLQAPPSERKVLLV